MGDGGGRGPPRPPGRDTYAQEPASATTSCTGDGDEGSLFSSTTSKYDAQSARRSATRRPASTASSTLATPLQAERGQAAGSPPRWSWHTDTREAQGHGFVTLVPSDGSGSIPLPFFMEERAGISRESNIPKREYLGKAPRPSDVVLEIRPSMILRESLEVNE
jgi:hypothetical protein